MKQLPDIFYEACAFENSRYAMDAPYRRDGFIYATDGRMCVRMADDGDWDVPVVPLGSSTPDAAYLFDATRYEKDPVAIPVLPPPKWQTAKDELDDRQHAYQLREEVHALVRVGSRLFRSGYLRRLKHAGITAVFLPKSSCDMYVPCYFRGDGWEGLLMSCMG